MIDGFNEPGKILPSSSREFLTRGKFRLFLLLSSPFFKKKEIDGNSAFNVSSNVFFSLSIRIDDIRTSLLALLFIVCSVGQTLSQLLFFPSSPFPAIAARTHIYTSWKKSRSLRIQPEFTYHPRSSNSAPCATAAKPVAHNWEKYTLREIEGKCEDTR